MATKNNPVLGYIKCSDCDGRSSVHKAGGNRSSYYYRRCDCGCDQRNGAAVQTALYNGCEWLSDALETAGLANPPPVPPNYVESTGGANSGAVEGDEGQPESTGELTDEVALVVADKPTNRPTGLIVGGLVILAGLTVRFLRGGAG